MKTHYTAAVCALGGLLLTRQAAAYTIETSVTRGCHEEITEDILRATRGALPGAAPRLPSMGDDDALIDDTPFTVPSDMKEIGAVTLLLGVRDNDVKSFAAQALDQLAQLNADPASQKQHCLRTAEQDEPLGSAAALEDCRAYIKETLLSALDGLDTEGRPDPKQREDLEVTLAIRRQVQVKVPMFYLRAGRALHTIEDSFTHSFRSVADPQRITVVLNWVDFANKSLSESRDGPAHLTELDRCDNPDPLRTERRRLAVEAGTSALTILLDQTSDRATKELQIDALLERYLAYDQTPCPGDGGADAEAPPSAANRWCHAPELAYASSGCGCKLARPRAPERTASLVALAALLACAWRRRTRARGPRARVALAAAALCCGLAVAPARAHAAGNDPTVANSEPGTGGPIHALQGKSESGIPGKRDPAGAFFGRVAFGASYDRPGFAGGIGVRYQLSHPLMLGFDTELNPWIAMPASRVRTGALNSYVSIIRRFQLATESLNVRSQVGVGVSVLLIDLVGAPAGSYGPFFGVSFLGAEWKISPGFYLTIDPTYIAIPIPHLTAAPFAYVQYRFQLGLEFGG